MNRIARFVILRRIDDSWRDHLLAMDDLRENVGWRGYAQMDPLVEYQKEASLMFDQFMFNVHKEVFEHFFLTQPVLQMPEQEQQVRGMEARHATLDETLPPPPQEISEEGEQDFDGARQGMRHEDPSMALRSNAKIGRNDPCTCGSGKKYKKCCGKNLPDE
jgi:preprotein translocase subunit SecA